VEAEQLGRKTGAGFYRHRDGRTDGPSDEFASDATQPIDDDEIVGRIVLAVVNEAYLAVGEGTATPRDVDTALRLGAGHPFGPFEWAASRGPATVVADLDALAVRLGDRFRPAPALRAAAEGCC
jgi:3-hydroxyacyl-CoA dehydrogenase